MRVALGSALENKDWAGLFRSVSKKMTKLHWLASRAFNDFVLKLVLTREFEIEDYNSFVAVVRMCYTVGTSGASKSSLYKERVVAKWYTDFQNLTSEDFPLVDKRGMGNVLTHATNDYAKDVKNYLCYGLRDHYVALLKLLGVANHKLVALRVLKKSVMERKGNFSFALSSDDESAARF